MTFGEAFTKAFAKVCDDLAPFCPDGAVPRWILTTLAYESKGFQINAVSSTGYSGLPQMAPTRNSDGTKTLYIALPGKLNAAVQMADAGRFWMGQIREQRIPSFPSFASFYCLNLAPARTQSRVVYAGEPPWRGLDGEPVTDTELLAELTFAYHSWPKNYGPQDKALDPGKKGWIHLPDLARPPEMAARVFAGRIDLELAALARFRGTAPTTPPPALQTVPRDGSDVAGIQRALAALGFEPGPVDGAMGPKTRKAIAAFQSARGLTADGVVGPLTLLALTNAAGSLRRVP